MKARNAPRDLKPQPPAPGTTLPVLPPYVRNAIIVAWVKGRGCQIIYNLRPSS
jgi:hypothetical protein